MVEDGKTEAQRELSSRTAGVLGVAEDAVQALVGVLLIVAAGMVLVSVGYYLVQDIDKGVSKAVVEALEGLLTVFILLELLAGIRATLTERKLVAEPFLIVGIIASIRGIILAIETSDEGPFDEAMLEIGVLGGLVLALAVASLLVRRKEREPEEG